MISKMPRNNIEERIKKAKCEAKIFTQTLYRFLETEVKDREQQDTDFSFSTFKKGEEKVRKVFFFTDIIFFNVRHIYLFLY